MGRAGGIQGPTGSHSTSPAAVCIVLSPHRQICVLQGLFLHVCRFQLVNRLNGIAVPSQGQFPVQERRCGHFKRAWKEEGINAGGLMVYVCVVDGRTGFPTPSWPHPSRLSSLCPACKLACLLPAGVSQVRKMKRGSLPCKQAQHMSSRAEVETLDS